MPTREDIRFNHAVKLLRSLEEQQHSGWECEYTIKSDSKSFPVHKSVLAGCSPALRDMVEKDKKQGTFDIGTEATSQIIKFIYSGTVDVTENNFQDLIHIAQVYQINGLEDLCLNYVEEDLRISNCFQWLRKSTVNKLENSSKIEEFIKDNFVAVTGTDEFTNLTQTDLSEYFKELELQPHHLWLGISSWVQHDTNSRKPDMVRLVQKNLHRFPPAIILDVMLQSDVISNSYRCKELLLEHVSAKHILFQPAINKDNCFNLCKLCASLPQSNTIQLQNDVVKFMIENFKTIENNDKILDLPLESVVALCEGVKHKNNEGENTLELTLKWAKHRLDERKDNFPHLFSFVNLRDFEPKFIEQYILSEKLVEESLECYRRVTKHLLREHACQSPSKKAKFDTPSEDDSSVEFQRCPYLVCYEKNSGDVIGFDLSKINETTSRKRQTIKTKIAHLKPNSDKFQTAFTLKGDLYVLRGVKLKVYNCRGESRSSWTGKTSLDEKMTPDVNAKIVIFQKELYLVGTGSLTIYHSESKSWSQKSVPEIKGSGFAVCANSKNLYVLGGDTSPRQTLEISKEPETHCFKAMEVKLTTHSRKNSSAVCVDEDIFLLGGSDPDAQKSAEWYRQSTRSWTLMETKMEFSRWSFSACTYDGKIYAVGGIKESSCTNDNIEVYDTKAADPKWMKFCNIPNFPAPFNACIFGRENNEGTTPKDTATTSSAK